MYSNEAPLLANQGVCTSFDTAPSGRTGALSSQLPFCGRGYSAKAGEGLKTNCEEFRMSYKLCKLSSGH